MNRWWGNATDSQKQAASRDDRAASRSQRSARDTLRNLHLALSSDEDDFRDCDTSIHNASIFNLDGQGDTESISSDADMADAAELARQRALPVEDADFENDPDS